MKRISTTCFAILIVSAAPLWAEMKTDIEYSKAGQVSLKLDVSVPEGAGPFPMAIIVHGGGWHGGDKAQGITPVFKPLTDAGFTWFSINYRLTPEYRWPACFEDLQAAIRWVKAHGAQFKGDPQRIVLVGHRAGGQLVAYAATVDAPDTRVQAVVAMSAVTDFEFGLEARGGLSANFQNLFNLPMQATEESRKLIRQHSPVNRVHPGMPPMLLLHGSADTNVGYQQSVNFETRLKAAGVPCELITVKDAPHDLGQWGRTDPTWEGKLVAWLKALFDPKEVDAGGIRSRAMDSVAVPDSRQGLP